MSRPFVHLHNHSDYSLLDGAIQVARMVQAAKDQEMPALAITDHGNLFGAISFYWQPAAPESSPSSHGGLHDPRRPPGPQRPRRPAGPETHHLVLLCENFEGYKNLMKLSSLAYQEGFYYKPRLDRELLRRFSGGLIATSACMTGEVNRLLLAGNLAEARASALELQEIFGVGRFFLEIQNHGIAEEDSIRERAVDLARATGIPLVATNDCHYLARGTIGPTRCCCASTRARISRTRRASTWPTRSSTSSRATRCSSASVTCPRPWTTRCASPSAATWRFPWARPACRTFPCPRITIAPSAIWRTSRAPG